jgi:hypothetical protein
MAIIPDFNPWESVRQGQQAEHALAQAEQEGLSWRERLALKRAAGQLGAQNYFAGYEGVSGAERPAYLKEAWQNTSPEQAMQLESLLAEPFKMNRAAEQAGKIEAAKKDALLDYTKKSMDYFYGLPDGQQAPAFGWNAFGEMVQAPGSGVLLPGQVMAGSPATASPVERTFEITPQGPKFSVKRMSDFEQSMKVGQDTALRKGTEIAKTKEDREAQNQAFDHVRRLEQEKMKTQEMLQQNLLRPEEAHADLVKLNQAQQAAKEELDALMRKQTPPVRTEALAAQPSRPVQSPVPVVQEPPPQGGLNYRDTQEIKKKSLEQQTTQANDAIEAARDYAMTAAQFHPRINDLVDLVIKEDLGHPALEGIYGAENALSLSRSNAQLKKLHDDVTNILIKPRQAQLMNTIIERQMISAGVPGLFTEPQLNKKAAVWLKSNNEHNMQLPSFLERWSASHQGTLDGAAEAWVDYTSHNPLYAIETDQRGRVTVKQKQVLPPAQWQVLRDSNRIRISPNGTVRMQHPDGSWQDR